MKAGRVCGLVALSIAVLTEAGDCFARPDVLARPSVWQRAADPSRAEAYRLLVAGERARVPATQMLDSPAMARLLNQRAIVMLQLANASALRSPPLDFFLGNAMVMSDAGYDEEGRRLLLRALAKAPDSPQAAQAWFSVAIASSRLRDHEVEHDAYTQALTREWDSEARAGIFMNRGETNMALGRLQDSMRDYRQALVLGRDPELQALARWGLAVALERDSDLPSALNFARAATSINVGTPEEPMWAIDLPTVFFTPEYDIHYYRALGVMARAAQLTDVPQQVSEFQTAAMLWSLYLDKAQIDGTPWIEHARRNRNWCVKRSEQAQKHTTQSAAESGRRGQ